MKSAFAFILFCHIGSASFCQNAQQNLMNYWKHHSQLGKLFLHLRIHVMAVLIGIACTSVTSCCDCDLSSDEELRQDIIGTWKKVECEYPFTDPNDLTAPSNILDEMTFHADGSVTEGGLYAYCCSTDCDTSKQGACTWVIEDGELTIVPDKTVYWYHLNQPYPIRCVNEDLLVFDNVVISSINRRKACFCRH